MVQLDDAVMRAALAKAILDQLTLEKRNELITAAVASVLEIEEVRRPGGYSNYDMVKRTKLQGMFNEAVADVARLLVVDVVKNDESLKGKIREMIAKVIDTFVSQKQDELSESFGNAISYALLKRDG